MNKKLIILCATIFSVVIITSGCSNSLKDENIKLTKEISSMKEKNSALEKSIEELKEENKNINKNSTYPIYSADINTYDKEVIFGAYIAEKLPLKDKIDALAKTLSEVCFSNLPIEILEITEVDGKKVAVINLKESEENQKVVDNLKFEGQSWSRNYFQGSTGGVITSVGLIETFLQKDYKGQWVDGVKFLYNNKIIDFDHALNLSEVSYRK
jgi:cell division protein FtsB